jgi:hypothetical protein
MRTWVRRVVVLVVAAGTSRRTIAGEAEAVAVIEKLGGDVTRDSGAMGMQIISVNLVTFRVP